MADKNADISKFLDNLVSLYPYFVFLNSCTKSQIPIPSCLFLLSSSLFLALRLLNYPVNTRRKLNVHKTFRRRPGRLLNFFCTFNLRPVSPAEPPCFVFVNQLFQRFVKSMIKFLFYYKIGIILQTSSKNWRKFWKSAHFT